MRDVNLTLLRVCLGMCALQIEAEQSSAPDNRQSMEGRTVIEMLGAILVYLHLLVLNCFSCSTRFWTGMRFMPSGFPSVLCRCDVML
jgi:hypothetical protein